MDRVKVAAGGTVVAMIMVAALAHVGRPTDVAMGVALAYVPWAGLLIWRTHLDERTAIGWGTGLAALAGLALLLAPPVLSDDIHRYLWDGTVARAGISPYAFAPDDPALASLRDESWRRINNPEIPTIYPPIAQLLFAVAPSLVLLKVAALLAHLATIPVVANLARNGSLTLAYALCPLVLLESALGGHVDAFAGLAIAGAVLALREQRPWSAALAAVIAVGVKLIGLLLVPLIWLRDRRAALFAVVIGLAMIVPLAGAGGESGARAGIGQYARRWRGNDGPFALVEAGATEVVAAIGPATGAPRGWIRFDALRPVLERTEGTGLDPRASLLGEKKAVADLVQFSASFVGSMAARGIVLAALLVLAIWLVRRRVEPLAAARLLLLTALLFAPQVHPWYLLWLLPLELAANRRTGVVWSAAILVAYAPLDGWLALREWIEPVGGRVFEYGVVLIVLVLEVWAGREASQAARRNASPTWTSTSRSNPI